MLKAMTIVTAVVLAALPDRGLPQNASDLERIKAAILRELVPPPLDEAKNYVAEGFKDWLPSPGDAAYEELEALRQQHVAAVDRAEAEILSTTFIDDYVLVLAHVLVVYKPDIEVPSPTSANGDLELYEFVRRDDGEWLTAAAPFPYSPQSFLRLYTRALENRAVLPPGEEP
jgi:hypothetical protein